MMTRDILAVSLVAITLVGCESGGIGTNTYNPYDQSYYNPQLGQQQSTYAQNARIAEQERRIRKLEKQRAAAAATGQATQPNTNNTGK